MLATHRRRGVLVVALALGALVFYVPRTYRTLAVIGDSAELVAAAATWGVPHPPGYPLYTLLTHGATRVAAFELPFRVHLTSALFHAATVGVVGALIELVTGSLGAALLGGVLLALGRIFFLGSLYAEVFPLNDLLCACLLFLGVAISQGNAGPPEIIASVTKRRWAALGVVLGLALAHHQMIVLALPALGILVGPSLAIELRERPRAVATSAAGALVLAASLYGLVVLAALRLPPVSWGEARDLDALLRLVTRQDYGGIFHAARHLARGQLLERLDSLAAGTAHSFGVIGCSLFLVGALSGWRSHRRVTVALLLAISCSGPLFAALNAFDIHSDYRVLFFERFATMCHVPFAVMCGFGVAQLEQWLARARTLSASSSLSARLARPGVARAAMSVLALFAVIPLVGNLDALDFSRNRRGLDYAHDLVDSTPDGALILLKSDMASQAVLYACAVERRCGDRIVFAPGQLWMPWKQRELHRRYPALALPPQDAPSAARWLVEQNAAARPVFVHPELVDEVVHGELASLPSLLLFRVYPSEASLRADLPEFRDAIAAVIQGRRCTGCALAKRAHPAFAADAQLARIYDDALRAHAAAATELGFDAEARALVAWKTSP